MKSNVLNTYQLKHFPDKTLPYTAPTRRMGEVLLQQKNYAHATNDGIALINNAAVLELGLGCDMR